MVNSLGAGPEEESRHKRQKVRFQPGTFLKEFNQWCRVQLGAGTGVKNNAYQLGRIDLFNWQLGENVHRDFPRGIASCFMGGFGGTPLGIPR